jgi:hypothetical protein
MFALLHASRSLHAAPEASLVVGQCVRDAHAPLRVPDYLQPVGARAYETQLLASGCQP